jgi:TolA-binding protein
MKTICSYVLLVIAGVLISACSGEKKAADLYEIAAFEELQTNTSHATQLYQEIIEKYPDTETALKARQALERLSAISEDKGQ